MTVVLHKVGVDDFDKPIGHVQVQLETNSKEFSYKKLKTEHLTVQFTINIVTNLIISQNMEETD